MVGIRSSRSEDGGDVGRQRLGAVEDASLRRRPGALCGLPAADMLAKPARTKACCGLTKHDVRDIDDAGGKSLHGIDEGVEIGFGLQPRRRAATGRK